jgi:hypothetical protein
VLLDGSQISSQSNGSASGNVRPPVTVTLQCGTQEVSKSIAVQGSEPPPPPPPPTGNGTATLSWGAVNAYTNGDAMTPAGYQPCHGVAPDAIDDCEIVTGLSYQFTELVPGTHYFTVRAVGENGNSSDPAPIKAVSVP